MQAAELERLKTTLLTLLQETEQPLRHRDEIAVENAPDSIDQVQLAGERELAIQQIEAGFNRLQSIRLALQRIDDGTYGTCIRCDGAIADKRLKAVPWTPHCVHCQDIADRENKTYAGAELVRAF
jgi:RNA polymerase-binding transcription factor